MQICFVDVTIKIKMGYLILPVDSINCCQRNLLFVTPILYQPNSLKPQVWNMLRNIKQINSYLKKLAVSVFKMTSLMLLVIDAYCENHTKRTNVYCLQIQVFFMLKRVMHIAVVTTLP
jgi:hypothetical protein